MYNLARLNRGVREGVANAVLVKMNQIGTLTETFGVIDRAREAVDAVAHLMAMVHGWTRKLPIARRIAPSGPAGL